MNKAIKAGIIFVIFFADLWGCGFLMTMGLEHFEGAVYQLASIISCMTIFFAIIVVAALKLDID